MGDQSPQSVINEQSAYSCGIYSSAGKQQTYERSEAQKILMSGSRGRRLVAILMIAVKGGIGRSK